MTFTEIVWTDKIKLDDAILLEGLPGVGNVGKLAAMHLIDELKAKKCMEIYSSHFPPQVLIDDDGIVETQRPQAGASPSALNPVFLRKPVPQGIRAITLMAA